MLSGQNHFFNNAFLGPDIFIKYIDTMIFFDNNLQHAANYYMLNSCFLSFSKKILQTLAATPTCIIGSSRCLRVVETLGSRELGRVMKSNRRGCLVHRTCLHLKLTAAQVYQYSCAAVRAFV